MRSPATSMMLRPMFKGRRSIVVLSAVAGAIAAALLVALSLGSSRDASAPDAAATGAKLHGLQETTSLLRGIPQSGTVLGHANARVTIVEYADLQCPYCAVFATDVFPSIVREYVRSGKAKIEFRGLTFVGPDSDPALRTALAAGQDGRLWHVVELLYHNQGAENSGWVTEDLLERAVSSARLDASRTLDARSDADVQRQLEAAADAATDDQVPGTPAFSVGPTGGALQLLPTNDAETLRTAIDAALAA